jgi:hypothetical protein
MTLPGAAIKQDPELKVYPVESTTEGRVEENRQAKRKVQHPLPGARRDKTPKSRCLKPPSRDWAVVLQTFLVVSSQVG